jgi:hypothetical protein
MKHTSGLWITSLNLAFRHIAIYSGFRRIAEVQCEIWGGNEEDQANARLIAAAPQLLDALQLILEHIGPEDNYIAPDTNWMRDLCHEAIAKATGDPE